MNDFGPTICRPRRRRWQRSPAVVAAGIAAAAIASVSVGQNVYGALNVGQPLHVRVHSGDSLWTIAAATYQSGDLRDHVDQIIALNHLSGGTITPGEELLLPAA